MIISADMFNASVIDGLTLIVSHFTLPSFPSIKLAGEIVSS